jgi:hypothetical protein
MSAIETILITAVAATIALAPKALDLWLSLRDASRVSHDESLLELAAGGAE